MTAQLAVLAVTLPLQLAVAAVNTRRHIFTAGEVRFWGVAIFIAVELAMLGLT